MNRLHMFKRLCNTLSNSNKIVVEHLNHRGIVRVNGSEVAQFMQGLITNDMKHLTEAHNSSMYTMFLNTKGRILYDGIIYRTQNPDTYFIECDSECAQTLQKHLRMYRIRRKIDVDDLGQEYKIWVIFDKSSTTHNELTQPLTAIRERFTCPCGDTKDAALKKDDFLVYRDPRLATLGLRVITNQNYQSVDIAKLLGLPDCTQTDMNYRSFRYTLGIGEGTKDLPPESCFPLEANGDYLHAVSFNKGCYIGQELTARIYHTGVIRKRLMPLYLETEFLVTPEMGPMNISTDTSAKVGKLRGVEGMTGLALLRIAPALAAKELDVAGITIKTQKPSWWPPETKSN